MSSAISVEHLRKTYRTPFARRRVEAVRDVSFNVEAGEVFGFLGPNGAGKTTTIRALMGLVKPTGGTVAIFGKAVPDRATRARIGFLPEAPYFYEYLSVRELVDLSGRIAGVGREDRRRRAAQLIEMVGLAHARDLPLKKYSKGMLQRAGIAQALVADPDLVVLDEPMSGLDPVGRKEVRDIILALKKRGKTVFFCSHILADVEAICDRVAIVVRGVLQEDRAIADLMDPAATATEVVFRCPEGTADAAVHKITEAVASWHRVRGSELQISLAPSADVDAHLALAREIGLKVLSVSPRHQTLEELFLQRAGDSGGQR